MASINIMNALIAICLALCGLSLGQDQNGQECVTAKPCICSGTRVICKSRQLRSIPEGIPLQTTSLDLSNNQLVTLNISQLSRLTDLQELLLHENRLREVPPWQALPSSLIRLSLHHNKITSIPSQNVTKRLSLQYLFLSSNRISYIGPNAFANLTSVQSLKLSRNRLTSIPVQALSQLTSLKKLDLTKNWINAVVSPLKSLKSVAILKLSKNKIHTISNNALWEMSNLRELYLDNNNLTFVATLWFIGDGNLHKLYLNNNRISKIEKGPSFDWRTVLLLGDLNLAQNELSYIHKDTFAHLLTLQSLNLGNNQIYHVEDGAFSDLSSLSVLDLRNNALSSILEGTRSAFEGLKKLVLLRLDGNGIPWIAANAFSGLKSVKSLNLSANIVAYIEENAFLEANELQFLYLNTTHLLCNCDLSWLPRWIEKKEEDTEGFKSNIHAVCLHPKPVERRSIFNLSSSEFVCDKNDYKPEITIHPQGHKVLLSKNVTLHCVVRQRNSTIKVNWTKNNKPLEGADITSHAQTSDGKMVTYSSELHLVSVTNKDSGNYQCVATNYFTPVQSKIAQITVLVFPRIKEKPSDTFVKGGETFELRCEADGSPEPQVSWQKDGGSNFPAASEKRIYYSPERKVYVIRNAQPADTGEYICSAANDAGSVNASAFVTVLKAPHVVHPIRSEVVVTVGDNAVLQCLVSGAPGPTVTWFKSDRVVERSSRIMFAEAGQVLVITEVKEDDGDKYSCEASNSEGTLKQSTELYVEPEKCTSVGTTEKTNKSKYVKYDKKTFLGIIVVVVVSCIVVTSMVWLFIQYNTLSCGKKASPRRRPQHVSHFEPELCDEANAKAFEHEGISYIPLKSSSSSSTQNSRESPRSTATFITSSESAQGPCINLVSSSENASGSEEKSSTGDNVSSENSLKGSHSSLTSSYPSDACLSSYQQVVTSAQIHVSDSDSEKHRPCNTRKKSETEDPGEGDGQKNLGFPRHYHEHTTLLQRPLRTNDDNVSLPDDANKDVCVTVYPLAEADTSCVTDSVGCSET